jgi:Tfp pilus assembly protein PilV
MTGRPAGLRDGFTVVEVLLALVLLSFMIMGFQAATGEIIHYAARSDRQAVAIQMAEDRLDLIRMDDDYDLLAARYGGTETAVPGYVGLQRTTRVVRTRSTQNTGLLDYTTVTVTVRGDGLRDPVARTLILGAP